jgi:hypothetical protein
VEKIKTRAAYFSPTKWSLFCTQGFSAGLKSHFRNPNKPVMAVVVPYLVIEISRNHFFIQIKYENNQIAVIVVVEVAVAGTGDKKEAFKRH